MNGSKTKKEHQTDYKERRLTGGVYKIENTRNNRLLLDAATDLRSSRNLFEFAKSTGSCVPMQLQADWKAQGGDGFVYEVLEELTQGETQTAAEFKADVALLKEIWIEKLAGRSFY